MNFRKSIVRVDRPRGVKNEAMIYPIGTAMVMGVLHALEQRTSFGTNESRIAQGFRCQCSSRRDMEFHLIENGIKRYPLLICISGAIVHGDIVERLQLTILMNHSFNLGEVVEKRTRLQPEPTGLVIVSLLACYDLLCHRICRPISRA